MTKPASMSSVESQVRRLASEHAHERDEAIRWLVEHPDASRPALRAIIEEERPRQETLGALYVLGQIGDEADVPLLAATLRRSPALIWESAQALGAHSSPQAFRALVEALSQADAETAGAAAVALGARGDPAARESLEALLRRPEETVRYRTVHALIRLGTGPSANVLRDHRGHEPAESVRTLIDQALAGNP